MSTKLTRTSPTAGFDLVDSHVLELTQATASFRERMVLWLISNLRDDGFEGLKANQLSFLGSLDCGANYAAELARTLGISRQAVHKIVGELESIGWLATRPDPALGNQRVIVFTEEGERMMSHARAHFARLDQLLLQQFSEENLAMVQAVLGFDPKMD